MAPGSPAMLAPAPFAGDPYPPTKGRQKVADHRAHQGQGDQAGHRRRSRVGEQPSQTIADPAVRLSGERKSVGKGKSVSVGVALGGLRIWTKKTEKQNKNT